MHIKSIQIKNFRNFNDFSINFSEGFQTIIGENNIGKSNLYWAIRLVLDRDLSYNYRNLDIKDFHGFRNELTIDDHIIISVELFGESMDRVPTFHVLKTSNNTARITYLFAHKSKFNEADESYDNIDLLDFKWRLYGGGDSINIEEITQLGSISFSDLDGINLYYINAFRNINSELHGSPKSLLNKYCQSRNNHESEIASINKILETSSAELNKLPFIPNISNTIQEKGKSIAGQYFSFPLSISFLSIFDSDAWSQLNLYYKQGIIDNIPINTLGLGQKNLLYLSLFIAELENSSSEHEINILLIEEPEAHLHPQLQKILFSNLNQLKSTQVLMTSHSTHIASDCEYKNLNILYFNIRNEVKSFSPFKDQLLSPRESLLLKRYLDATRSELFFASAIIFVEGVGEQFIIPAIAKKVYGINLSEYNISVIPIHSRYFDPYLKLVQDNNLELPVVAIIDGDSSELEDGEDSTTAVENAKKFEVNDRVFISVGSKTLEIDLFPNRSNNLKFLEQCFQNLGHSTSYNNLINATEAEHIFGSSFEVWESELIKRVDKTVKKGRFAQELSLLIDNSFVVPQYIQDAILHIARCKDIKTNGS